MEVTVKVPLKLSSEDIDDILCTALEGYMLGCWAVIVENEDLEQACSELKEENIPCYWHNIIQRVWENNHSILLLDIEESGYESVFGENGCDKPWILSKDRFIKGIELYCEQRGSVKEALKNGSFDDVEADCLIQYAVFGDVIFG